MLLFLFVLLCVSSVSASVIDVNKIKTFEIVHVVLESKDADNTMLDIQFEANGTVVNLQLERNMGFLHPEYKEYVVKNGIVSEKALSTDLSQHCYYLGYLPGETTSSAALSNCHGGFQGYIHSNGIFYIIHPEHLTTLSMNERDAHRIAELYPSKTYSKRHQQRHIFFKHDDLEKKPYKCGVDETPFFAPRALDHLEQTTVEKPGRKLLQTVKYVELLLVNDYLRYNFTVSNTEPLSLQIANGVDGLWNSNDMSPLIRVVLTGQITFQSDDPYSSQLAGALDSNGQMNVHSLLSAFLDWGLTITRNYPALPSHDIHVLVSGYNFQDPTVGLAPVGEACRPAYTGAVVEADEHDIATVISIMTHEMGHTINMSHDGTPDDPRVSSCPQSGFIMQAVQSSPQPATIFSSCSKSTWTTWAANTNQVCLNNIPTKQWSDDNAVCGNGIIEGGEQCDCGSNSSCPNDPCCNGPICKLKSGSRYQCSNSQICCTNCTYIPASEKKQCRVASNAPCDNNAFCDGTTGICPTTGFASPGTSCTKSGVSGVCFEGACKNWEDRCKANNPLSSACSNHDYDPNYDICQRQYCTNDTAASPQVCYNVSTNSTSFAEDGVSCATGKQCFGGVCVSSTILAPTSSSDPGNGGTTTEFDINKIIIYVAIALGGFLLFSIFYRLCCTRERRVVYVQRMKQRRDVPRRPEGGGGAPRSQPPRDDQVDVGGGLVLEFVGDQREGEQRLPPGWTQHQTSDGRPYWFNASTGTTSWEFPQ